jgi:hypothetical protein
MITKKIQKKVHAELLIGGLKLFLLINTSAVSQAPDIKLMNLALSFRGFHVANEFPLVDHISFT